MRLTNSPTFASALLVIAFTIVRAQSPPPAEPGCVQQGVDHEINANHKRRHIQESGCRRDAPQIGGRLLRVAK